MLAARYDWLSGVDILPLPSARRASASPLLSQAAACFSNVFWEGRYGTCLRIDCRRELNRANLEVGMSWMLRIQRLMDEEKNSRRAVETNTARITATGRMIRC